MPITKKALGFTLIELMVVVAVIAILASISYPSYQDYIFKGRRSDGKSGLLSLQIAQEKFRASCTQYADNLVAIGSYVCNTGTNTYSAEHSTTSPDGNYNLTSVGTATTYTLTATTTGAQASDTKCKTLSIDQDNNKTATNSANNATTVCW